MRVVANWNSELCNFTKGNIYNITKFGCENDCGHNYTIFLKENEGTLIEKWNKTYTGKLQGIFTEVKEDTMKKSDLKNGMVVETRSGNRYLVLGDNFVGDGYLIKKEYDEQLNIHNGSNRFYIVKGSNKFDIVKIYDVPNKLYSITKLQTCDLYLLWERETEQQKQIKELKKIIEDAANKIREIEGE